MSHLVNPQLVEGYVDDFVGKSVQGVYQGTLDAPQERIVDRILKGEREQRRQRNEDIERLKGEFSAMLDRIVKAKRRGASIDRIKALRARLLEIRIELERLTDEKI